RTGPWRVDVAVMRAGTVPVGDVAVHVRAEPLDGATPATEADAERDTDPLGMRYRASLRLGTAGPWAVAVAGTGPEGAGSLHFPVDVEPASSNWGVLATLAVAGIAMVAAVTRLRRRRLLTVGVAVLLLASPAWPHASLVRSSPARRATLTTAPDRHHLSSRDAI